MTTRNFAFFQVLVFYNHFSETAFSFWVLVKSTAYYITYIELTLQLSKKPRGVTHWM